MQPGARLGPHEIFSLVGAGGMGEVESFGERRRSESQRAKSRFLPPARPGIPYPQQERNASANDKRG
jgi:hypothetical protein